MLPLYPEIFICNENSPNRGGIRPLRVASQNRGSEPVTTLRKQEHTAAMMTKVMDLQPTTPWSTGLEDQEVFHAKPLRIEADLTRNFSFYRLA
jgi:hypothetical protein